MIVLKYGGHVLDESQSDDPIIKTITSAHKAGTEIVVVHGGGPVRLRQGKSHGATSDGLQPLPLPRR